MSVALPILLPLLFLTLSVQHTWTHVLIPRSTITSPMKTSSLPQGIRYFLLRANMYLIPLLLYSSWTLLPFWDLDNSGSYPQIFRQWESRTLHQYLYKPWKDFHVHNQLNLWALATACVVFVPDNLDQDRNTGCVQFLQKCPSLTAFVLFFQHLSLWKLTDYIDIVVHYSEKQILWYLFLFLKLILDIKGLFMVL